MGSLDMDQSMNN